MASNKDFTLIKNLVFVKQGSNGNGTLWDNAFGSFESALQPARLANYPSNTEIWVAAGTYNRQESVPMLYVKSGLKIYGGFSSFTPEQSVQSRSSNKANNKVSLNSSGSELLAIYDENGGGLNDVRLDRISFSSPIAS